MEIYYQLAKTDDGQKLSVLLMNLKGNAYLGAEQLGCTTTGV